MPTYEYVCPAGHAFEKFQKMSESTRVKCPTCGKVATRRISGGAGLVFKGSGFYITDYGKDGKGPRKAAEGEKSSTEAPPPKAETKSDSTAAKKPEPKPKADKPAGKKATE